jgi:hypothetical protein
MTYYFTTFAIFGSCGGISKNPTAPGVTVAQVIAATDAELVVPPDVSEMPL